MSRTPRQLSEHNVYHVFARGVGRLQILEDDEDNAFFLGLLRRFSLSDGCDMLAYCLMGNHFHLLVRMEMRRLSEEMRRLEVSYAQYFNEKYERTGTLFQGRFGSEPVDSDEQLLAALRYIHLNPQKAGIAPFDAYEWSSYREYTGSTGTDLASTSLALEMVGGADCFERFHRIECDDQVFMDENTSAGRRARKRLTDQNVREMARGVLGVDRLSDLGGMSREGRNAALVALKDMGATVRQIERLTGISRGVIGRAGREAQGADGEPRSPRPPAR